MPHSHKSTRANLIGAKPRPHVSTGQSDAQKNATQRSKILHSSTTPIWTPPRVKGPRQIRFASDAQREAFNHGPFPLAASGGFGCIAAGTRIYDAELDRHVEVQNIDWEPLVLAWDGSRFITQRATKPYIKGRAPLFEIYTAGKRCIVVTDEHRFLTPDGWVPFSVLRAEHAASGRASLLACDGNLLPSTWVSSPLVHAEGDPRSSETTPGYLGGCSHFHCRCGGQLHPVSGSVRSSSPLRDDARTHTQRVPSHTSARTDAPVSTASHTRLSLGFALQPSDGSRPPASLHAAQKELASFEERVGLALSALEESIHAGFPPHQDPSSQDGKWPSGVASGQIRVGVSSLDFIVEVEALGVGDFYDLHVPVYENYLAEGFINHNSSKTYGLCLKAMYLSATYPGNRGLIARKQVKKLEMTTMKTFWKVCPPEAYAMGSRSDQAKRLVLNNGSEIIWSQLDDSEILEMIRGLEINWFFIDQAEEISEEIFEVLLRRLGRWDQAVVPQYLLDAEHAAGREWPWYNHETGQPLPPTYGMIACNPDHELHWIYRRFHEKSPEWAETYKPQGYKMIHFDSTKNVFLPDQNRDQLLKGTPEFIARFVHGEWGIPEGQIHKIDPMSLLRWSDDLDLYIHTQCKLSRTMDHGESAPTCCIWWALDKFGNLFAYREYYQADRLISFHRQRIYEMSLVKTTTTISGEKQTTWVPEKYESELADPSIFTPRTQRGVSVSVAEEYMEINEAGTDKHSAIWWQRGDNNELGTRNRINEFLRLDPDHKHPFTGKLGAPRLYFVERGPSYPDGCFELIRQTRSARRVKVGTQDGKDVFSDERDSSIADHALDPLRYRIADMDALPVEAVRRAAPGTVDHCIAEFKRSDLRRGRKRMDGTSRSSDLARLPPKLADFFRGRRL